MYFFERLFTWVFHDSFVARVGRSCGPQVPLGNGSLVDILVCRNVRAHINHSLVYAEGRIRVFQGCLWLEIAAWAFVLQVWGSACGGSGPILCPSLKRTHGRLIVIYWDKDRLVGLSIFKLFDHFHILCMDIQNGSFAGRQVRVRNGFESNSGTIRHEKHLLTKLITQWILHLSLALVMTCVVVENITTRVTHEVINVLAIDLLVKNVDILSLTLRNFWDLFHKALVLQYPLIVPII